MGSAASPGTIVVAGGFLLAFVFGLAAARTNFCIMGALSDVVNMGSWARIRMWMLAVAVAIAGTAALSFAGQADLAQSLPQRTALPWLSLLVGGALFGVGMTLAGGCANRNLLRAGGGSVRSLVVLAFLAIASYMTLKGLFAQWRADWLDPVRIDLGAWGWKDASLATATASIQVRMRVHEPMFTMSDSAPMVQKLVLWATAPNTNASAKPPQTTIVASWKPCAVTSTPGRERSAARGAARSCLQMNRQTSVSPANFMKVAAPPYSMPSMKSCF